MNFSAKMLRDDALVDKVIVITGGGSGLGKAMTKYFMELGAKVAITSRDIEKLKTTSAELEAETGGTCLPVQCDVRHYEEVEAMLQEVLKAHGKVDVLLNNAAGNFISPTERLSANAFDTIIDIVLKGSKNCTLAFGKHWIDTKQESTPPEKPLHLCNELVSFEIKSSSLSNEITYCTMLEKAGRYKWEPQVENHYFDPAIPVYSWKNVCVTPNGLVYDLYHIYTGKYAVEDESFNYWKNSNVDIFTPLQKRNRMFAIPFPNNTIFKHLDMYVLQYLSQYLRLSVHYPNTSFWFPSSFSTMMDELEWKMNDTSFVSFDENSACWVDEVIGFVPSPATQELSRENITLLRSILPTWLSSPIGKICTIVSDEYINNELIEKVGSVSLDMDEEWSIRVVSSEESGNWSTLLGSSLCIFVGGKNTQTKW